MTLSRFVSTAELDRTDPKERKSTSPDPDPALSREEVGGDGGRALSGVWQRDKGLYKLLNVEGSGWVLRRTEDIFLLVNKNEF